MIELLSPVGDFECLKAAVQNGANAVYFGASLFNARAFASNFDDEALKNVIHYAKLRNVKTHLTLNTLIKENEFEDAFNLAKKAYELGIDAIIVQDLGLASTLISSFPDLEIHASTQMTIHNLEGAIQAQKLGFKRVVLSRELSISEIKYICKNSKIDIECFAHGALCISYSGQCLFSSLVGGRSGNRGKCAQPCRLPYELIDDQEKVLDKGYLLSTRDLCSLENLPKLINAGVKSLKIEGRMKSPEYVATVTRIYRKYIDLAYKYIKNEIDEYKIDSNDIKELMQVFNRGGFSSGHLQDEENRDLVFKEKPNNMGLYLGKVIKFNSKKGLVTCNLKNNISIGDSISFEKENSKYTISELMNKDFHNIKSSEKDFIVTFGRMKGNININDKIYKISEKELSNKAIQSFSKEFIKIPLICDLKIKKGQNILLKIDCPTNNKHLDFEYDYLPEESKSSPISREKIINQFSKTQDTCFEFKNINIDLEDNVFMPVSILNDIRRIAILKIQELIINSFYRKSNDIKLPERNIVNTNTNNNDMKMSLLLNNLSLDFNYSNLSISSIDKLYIPLEYFENKKYSSLLSKMCNKFNLYIYLPLIMRNNYHFDINRFKTILQEFNIKGIVLSHLSNITLLNELDFTNLDIVANYTFNVYNSYTNDILQKLNISTSTISPELDKTAITHLCSYSMINKELIVYGNTPLMTTNYCLLGKSNKCYSSCTNNCLSNNKYYIKDRLGLKFRIIPKKGITTIYNSKTLSIEYSDFNINSLRIDIIDESIDEINNIISHVKNNKKLEGKNYTNGNLNREI